jgi:hypothetical protein
MYLSYIGKKKPKKDKWKGNKIGSLLGMVVHAYSSSTRKVEVDGSQVQG